MRACGVAAENLCEQIERFKTECAATRTSDLAATL